MTAHQQWLWSYPQHVTSIEGTGWNLADSAGVLAWSVFGTHDTEALHIDGDLSGATYPAIRGKVGRNSGKHYAEFKVINGPGASMTYYVGITTSNYTITTQPNPYAVVQTGQSVLYYATGQVMSTDVPLGPSVAALVNGDVVGLAVDFTTGIVTVLLNNSVVGTAHWQITGTPVMLPYLSTAYYDPADIQLHTSIGQCTYSPPGGYDFWE